MIEQYYPAGADATGALTEVSKSFALFCCYGILGAPALFVARGNLYALADTIRSAFPTLADQCEALADSPAIMPCDAWAVVDAVRAAVR